MPIKFTAILWTCLSFLLILPHIETLLNYLSTISQLKKYSLFVFKTPSQNRRLCWCIFATTLHHQQNTKLCMPKTKSTILHFTTHWIRPIYSNLVSHENHYKWTMFDGLMTTTKTAVAFEFIQSIRLLLPMLNFAATRLQTIFI